MRSRQMTEGTQAAGATASITGAETEAATAEDAKTGPERGLKEETK